MPTKKGVCQECGVDHPSDQPHNRNTMLYQYTFYDKAGRWPTWADAMEHCPDDIKAYWTHELSLLGVNVESGCDHPEYCIECGTKVVTQ